MEGLTTQCIVLQTTKKSEMELLLKLLPRYYEHVERYPHTFLIKFFGLHRVTTHSGGRVEISPLPSLTISLYKRLKIARLEMQR